MSADTCVRASVMEVLPEFPKGGQCHVDEDKSPW